MAGIDPREYKELQSENIYLKHLLIALYQAGNWMMEGASAVRYVCVGCGKHRSDDPPHEDDCPVAAAQAVFDREKG